ncbi:MAG: hypothetical protein J0L84_00635 [Verrucomicrobia bacterium]|nr:hypothetical protein [Verrucomicrobiota bacterium]
MALLFIASVSWQARRQDPVSAELIEITTDDAGITTAVFMITNRTSTRFGGSAAFEETSSKRRVWINEYPWITMDPYGSKRFATPVPPGTGDWVLELTLENPEPGKAARSAGHWLSRTVGAITPKSAIGLQLQKRIITASGMGYFVRSAPIRANQAIRRGGTVTNAP